MGDSDARTKPFMAEASIRLRWHQTGYSKLHSLGVLVGPYLKGEKRHGAETHGAAGTRWDSVQSVRIHRVAERNNHLLVKFSLRHGGQIRPDLPQRLHRVAKKKRLFLKER